ncbi:glycosyl hydrolase family 43 [Niabella ginsenosidivorans]|uniref:Glycosyl hydrolase family 43 n=1 Tax=Niabella ginsenosidivorans TaxID=1176587 RepID=A0A1A9HZN5_9BACT|nr:glycoside hydrolase family 43 protein [Niabella ginsenosidivorans]ANH80733.1 glycosyl hydrolase family 43 [Niabella ginsenosidivorans]
MRRKCIAAIITLAFTIGCGKSGGDAGNGGDGGGTQPVVKKFTNPILSSGPDPWVTRKGDYYYYTQTTGNGIKLWKTQYVDDLRNAVAATVWTPAAGTAYAADVWAPELHYLDNKWYLYVTAATAGNNASHRIYVLENSSADPLNTGWVFKGKVADPSDKFAIDATVFTYKNNNYMVWSGWQGDVDGEQDLFIAKLSNPYTIEGSRVLISKPTYDWEKISTGVNVLVNEGPEVVQNANGNVFLTYSANGCWSDDYCLGMLSLKADGDPLNPADWTKSPVPVFTKNTSGGAFGPGHNGFFKSPDGKEDWIIYHANSLAGQGCGDTRNPRIQKFTWKQDGTPDFGMPVKINEPVQKPSGE